MSEKEKNSDAIEDDYSALVGEEEHEGFLDDNDTWDLQEEELSNRVELLTFSLEKEQYGINVMDISELIRPVGITHVPRAPSYIDGIVSVRGAIIPMVNLKKILGLSELDKVTNSRYIFVKTSKGVVGFIADMVMDVVQIPEASIEPPPSIKNVRSDLIGGVGRFGDRMIILLDFINIMNVLKDIEKISSNKASIIV